MNEREVARLYNVHDVSGIHRTWGLCPLPGHEETTPSFSIYHNEEGKQMWRCHGRCDESGDVIDLVGELRIPNYDRHSSEDVKLAISILQSGYSISPVEIKPQKKMLTPNIFADLDELSPQGIKYLVGRGVSLEVIEKMKIKQKGNAIALPAYENHQLQAIKYRSMSENPKLRYWSERGSKAALFGFDNVKFTKDTVFIVKGEIAALVMMSNGFLACAPTAGEQGKTGEWLGILWFAKRIVIGDNDNLKMDKVHGWAKQRAYDLNAQVKFPPKDYKDVDEWIINSDEALTTLNTWTKQSSLGGL